MKKRAFGFLILTFGFFAATGQEALLSENAEYYGLLELMGLSERPTLNYRTLSDDRRSVASGDNPWQDLELSTTRKMGSVDVRIYGPELFNSYNTAYPHGFDDGVLWQGVGLNSSLSAGIRAEAFGFEATVKPVVAFEQNKDFDILPSTATGSDYGYFWHGDVIDLYQRPGDKPVYAFDWGDTELRYTYGTFTLGFGTQAVWLGPSRRNAILSSNNAPSYPKFDFGLRKTATPIGDVEARGWWGYTSASEYASSASNSHSLFTGLSLSLAPAVLPGLTLGVNRVMFSEWGANGLENMLVLSIPTFKSGHGDQDNQEASLTADYLLPAAGVEAYVEWARDDYSPSINDVVRYPFHTQGYTLGMRKLVGFGESKRVVGVITAEITDLESSRDYEFLGPWSWYTHGLYETQGATNGGQIIGAGIGTGGNSQYLGFSVYYPRGRSTIYVQRMNRDNDYVYFMNYGGSAADKIDDQYKFNAEMTYGAETAYFLTDSIRGSLGLACCMNYNPLYNPTGHVSSIIANFYITAGLGFKL
jgi:hypothetical protein